MGRTKLRLSYLSKEDRQALRDPTYHSWICELGCYHKQDEYCECKCHGDVKKINKLLNRIQKIESEIERLQTTTQGKCSP